MCFSAEASFIAAASLTVVGLVLIAKFYNSKKILLALIPFFFGIQQFAEGIIWIRLESNAYSSSAQYLYLFFAMLFWPLWMPLAFAIAERIYWRQVALGILVILGLGFFLSNGYELVVHGFILPQIREHSIYYGPAPLLARILYGVATLPPFFLSSIRKMWILGIANVLAFVVATLFYDYAFISIWCGVGAILAIGFVLTLKKTL